MGVPGVTAEFVTIGAVRHRRARALQRDRRSHLARHPVLSRVPEERGARGHDGHQQPVLVERRRQVLQLRAGGAARRRGAADRASCRTSSIRRARPIESMRNLQYPLDWDDGVRLRRVPGVPEAVRRRRLEGRVQGATRPSEFFAAYDQIARPLHDAAARRSTSASTSAATSSASEHVRVMPYDPRAPHHERYVRNPPAYDPALLARVERDAITLCRALGYDLNTVEFAVEDGVPYAIDFMNPAPDAESRSVGDDELRLDRRGHGRPGRAHGARAAAAVDRTAGTRSCAAPERPRRPP